LEDYFAARVDYDQAEVRLVYYEEQGAGRVDCDVAGVGVAIRGLIEIEERFALAGDDIDGAHFAGFSFGCVERALAVECQAHEDAVPLGSPASASSLSSRAASPRGRLRAA